jgi:hypothetical protein
MCRGKAQSLAREHRQQLAPTCDQCGETLPFDIRQWPQ